MTWKVTLRISALLIGAWLILMWNSYMLGGVTSWIPVLAMLVILIRVLIGSKDPSKDVIQRKSW